MYLIIVFLYIFKFLFLGSLIPILLLFKQATENGKLEKKAEIRFR